MNYRTGLRPHFLASEAREYLQRVAEGARVGNSPAIQRILAWFVSSGPITHAKFSQAERMILRHAVRAPAFPGIRKPSGRMVKLGVKEDGSTWSIPIDLLAKHTLLLGASGSGKSVQLRAVIGSLLERSHVPNNPHVLAFDFKKALRRLIGRFDNLLVIPWQLLRCNFYVPPAAVSLADWNQREIDRFVQIFDLREPSRAMLARLHRELYQALRTEETGVYPCLLDLHELMVCKIESEDTSRSDKGKLETLQNRVEGILDRAGSVFACAQGFPISEILKRNCLIELDGLGTDLQSYIATGIMEQAFRFYLANGMQEHAGTLRTLLVIDEAAHLFGREV